MKDDVAGSEAEVNNQGVSSCSVSAGLLSSVLRSLQSPAITSVPLHSIVWQF